MFLASPDTKNKFYQKFTIAKSSTGYLNPTLSRYQTKNEFQL